MTDGQKLANPIQAKAVEASGANPAPLGLMGFGMTTVLLMLMTSGLVPGGMLEIVIAMGIFYGGLAQIIAGLLEFKKGNSFGTLAFTSYGLFWLTWVALKLLPILGIAPAADSMSMAAFHGIWGLFTGYMFIGTLNKNRALQFVFGSLTVLFFMLAIADVTGSSLVKTLAGYEGIICGFSAIYLACAETLNETFKRQVLPIGTLS